MRDLTIVFDLDGTLVDTAPDLVAATNHALSDLGLPPLSAAVLRPQIGFGARRMIIEGLRITGTALPETEVDRLLARFLLYYEANIAAESRPFPGAVPVLERLRDAGARLAVCTNKRESLSRALLAALGLADHFAALAGRDTFPSSKPDPGHLLGTIALAGGAARQAVMIGDTRIDVATAKAASVPVVACAFGYSDVAVDELGADAVIRHFDELEDAISRLVTIAEGP
jgi:phosphoglycolate phosphatase